MTTIAVIPPAGRPLGHLLPFTVGLMAAQQTPALTQRIMSFSLAVGAWTCGEPINDRAADDKILFSLGLAMLFLWRCNSYSRRHPQ